MQASALHTKLCAYQATASKHQLQHACISKPQQLQPTQQLTAAYTIATPVGMQTARTRSVGMN
jgi:hypothetical protein